MGRLSGLRATTCWEYTCNDHALCFSYAVASYCMPIYIFTTPILKLLGQPHDVAVQSGLVAVWSIPQHMSFAFVLPAFKFLQAQLKPGVYAWVSMGTLGVHVAISWLFMYKFRLGVVGIAVAMDISWWIMVVGMFGYVLCGGCPETWTGFSVKAFSGLWDFFKLSAASGVMIWYDALSPSLCVFVEVQLSGEKRKMLKRDYMVLLGSWLILKLYIDDKKFTY